MAYTITLTVLESNGKGTSFPVESFNTSILSNLTGSSGASGKVALQDLEITKLLDTNSELLRALFAGTMLEQVSLIFSRSSSTSASNVVFDFKLAAISQITFSGTGHGGTFPTETISFKYGAFEVRYPATLSPASPD